MPCYMDRLNICPLWDNGREGGKRHNHHLPWWMVSKHCTLQYGHILPAFLMHMAVEHLGSREQLLRMTPIWAGPAGTMTLERPVMTSMDKMDVWYSGPGYKMETHANRWSANHSSFHKVRMLPPPPPTNRPVAPTPPHPHPTPPIRLIYSQDLCSIEFVLLVYYCPCCG